MDETLQIIAVLKKKYAMSQEDAEKILPQLTRAIINKQIIKLSFLNVENCSSIFLKNLLGKLYLEFGTAVDSYVQYVDIDNDDLVLPDQLERLRKRALNPGVYKPIFDNAFGKS